MKLLDILFYAFILFVSWGLARELIPDWFKYDREYQRQIKRERKRRSK